MKEGSRILNVSPKVYNGVSYRSTLEAETAKTLDLLGIPFSYECRKITLLEGFRCPFQTNKVTHITYTPDFEIGDFIILECKGFETPEWKLKRKLVYRYLMDNEPRVCFYQIHDNKRQLLEALDHNWLALGYSIEVTPKPKRKNEEVSPILFSSIDEAFRNLNLEGKPKGALMKSLIGKVKYVYGYEWKLKKITL